MQHVRLRAGLVSIVSAVVVATAAVPAQASPALPNSMAAIGDSMTRAADVCCWYGDHPANSWSTGSAGWDGVSSHYERILARNGKISGRNHNDAVSGARMSDGPNQARDAVAQKAQYVTVLLGANDVCTSSPATMTSVDTFRSQTRQTLEILKNGLPSRSVVFVSSIPDVYQLWSIYHTDSVASAVWETASICQSLLDPSRTDADRLLVRERNRAFNEVLQQECEAYGSRCKFDNNAVFNYDFAKSDVSKLDYFHPSLIGQAHLAQITWGSSWWA